MKLKNILLCASVLGGLALSSCTGNFLDEDRNPNSLDPENFWKSESDILKGLTAAYAGLPPRRDRLDGTGHVQQRIDQLRAQR